MSYVDASKIQALFTPQYFQTLWDKANESSFVLANGTRLPNLTSTTLKMKIVDQLPTAYWTEADISLRKPSYIGIVDKYITPAEAHVLVTISKQSIADSSEDIESLVRNKAAEAIAKLIDRAVLVGDNKPAGWREGILSTVYNLNAAIASTGNLYNDVSDAMSKVEESDYEVDSIIGGTTLSGFLRKNTDSQGNPITGSYLDGLNKKVVKNGVWDKSKANVLVGDVKQIYYAKRQEMEVDVFTEGTIKDPNTGQEYLLGQQRMVAIMLTMRLGWEIPNPVTYENEDNAEAFPFAIVKPTSASNMNTINLTLTVKDAITSTTIPGATLFVNGVRYVSQEGGTVTVPTKPNTEYSVSAFKGGYYEASEFVTTNGTATSADVLLKPYPTITIDSKQYVAQTEESMAPTKKGSVAKNA